jgi:hypothetical protein
MIEEVALILAGLTGLGGFISIAVNLLKQGGLVKEGESDAWFGAMNLVAYIAVSVVYFTNYPVNWLVLDDWLIVLGSLIGLIVQMVGGRITYRVLRGTPIVGYSFSLAQGESSVDDLLFDFDLYTQLAETIVRSLEQDPAYTQFSGEEKKQRALMELSAWFESQQVDVSFDTLCMLIEAAVQIMKSKPEIYVGLAD